MSTENATEGTGAETSQQVVVEDSIQAGIDTVWKALISPEGEQILLGDGAQLGDKGDDWHSTDGHHGVMRSFHPREQIRFSWHAAEGDPATMVEVDLTDEGSAATHVAITHSKLPAAADTTALHDEWERKIDRLGDLAGGR